MLTAISAVDGADVEADRCMHVPERLGGHPRRGAPRRCVSPSARLPIRPMKARLAPAARSAEQIMLVAAGDVAMKAGWASGARSSQSGSNRRRLRPRRGSAPRSRTFRDRRRRECVGTRPRRLRARAACRRARRPRCRGGATAVSGSTKTSICPPQMRPDSPARSSLRSKRTSAGRPVVMASRAFLNASLS